MIERFEIRDVRKLIGFLDLMSSLGSEIQVLIVSIITMSYLQCIPYPSKLDFVMSVPRYDKGTCWDLYILFAFSKSGNRVSTYLTRGTLFQPTLLDGIFKKTKLRLPEHVIECHPWRRWYIDIWARDIIPLP